MIARPAVLIFVLLVQPVTSQTVSQGAQTSTADKEKALIEEKKRASPFFDQACAPPAKEGARCGVPRELHLCNIHTYICCTIGDDKCLSQR